MKKLTSSLVAAGMLVASITPVYASAINVKPLNELSIESETLTEDITIDGKVIPSGTLAVTVNIENNTGFENSKTMIELGEAFEVIKNDDNRPVIFKGETFDNSYVRSIEVDNIISVASISTEIENNDGAMFTFYVEVDDSIENKIMNIIDVPETSSSIANSVNSVNSAFIYLIGDVNNDFFIDASDATCVYTALTKCPPIFNSRLPVYVAETNLSYYLCDSCRTAWAADTYIEDVRRDGSGTPQLNEGIISIEDVDEIMDYYLYGSAHDNPTQYSGRVGTTARLDK